MTLDILPLFAACLACVSVLVLFAHHNKRTSWAKPHRLAREDLAALAREWKSFPAPVMIATVTPPILPRPLSLNGRIDFTLQLANIQRSTAERVPQKIAERDRVTA